MSNYTTIRGFVAATALMSALVSGTAALADDDERDSDDSAQVMPFGYGAYGGMNMMTLPIDANSDGIVSASEASQHASAGFSLFDNDGDGAISEDEYLDKAASASTVSRGRRNLERLFLNRIARFKDIDSDGDESVTLAEFMAKAQASYEAADTNGDGTITVWEYRAQQNPF
ncbi:MAG: EF-hand domain-containing protein [Yoonia sp.]